MTSAALVEVLTSWGPPGLMFFVVVYMLVRGRVSVEYPYEPPRGSVPGDENEGAP